MTSWEAARSKFEAQKAASEKQQAEYEARRQKNRALIRDTNQRVQEFLAVLNRHGAWPQRVIRPKSWLRGEERGPVESIQIGRLFVFRTGAWALHDIEDLGGIGRKDLGSDDDSLRYDIEPQVKAVVEAMASYLLERKLPLP